MSIFLSWAIKKWKYFAIGAGVLVASAWCTHKADSLYYESRITAQAARQTAAEALILRQDAAIRKLQSDAGVTYQQLLLARVAQTTETIKEVPRYVKVSDPGCVTYGLVRVLDAAVYGISPANLSLPAGKSDDACTALTPVALASSVVENYGLAERNADQLDALIELIQKEKESMDAVASH